MSYKNLVKQFTHDGYMKKLAGDIKNKMTQLRQQANPNDDRRWIWELLQNGKDVRVNDENFNAKVILDNNPVSPSLEFQHNGKPFSVKNITYLVEQVSSKDQDILENGKPASTGKFGNGFLTTHLLSEIVGIDTIVKADGLNYKKCQIELDRSKRDEKGLVESVIKSLSVLEKLDEFPDLLNYNPSDFNTCFRYKLDESSVKIANTGLDDLETAIAYTLAFVPVIKVVTIANRDTSYKLIPEETKVKGNISIYLIEKSVSEKREKIYIAKVKGDKVEVALPLSITEKTEETSILPLPDHLPKLFCDFPLIGTEEFPFPAIINSPFFNLNDPRSIVRLTDIPDEDIDENKALLKEAVELYKEMLRFLELPNVHDTFYAVSLPSVSNKEWISDRWYKQEISDPIFESLSTSAIVETALNKKKSVLNSDGQQQLVFPTGTSDAIRNGIFNLAEQWFSLELPKKDDIHNWQKFAWPKCPKLNLKKLAENIAAELNIYNLQKKLVENTDVIIWLNEFYDLLNLEENYIKDIVANEVSVLPDQNGNFKQMISLSFDPGIPELIKGVYKFLGEDIRETLRIREIHTVSKYNNPAKHPIVHPTRELNSTYASLNQLIKQAPHEQQFKAAMEMAQLFFEVNSPVYREKLFNCLSFIFPDQNLVKISISLEYAPIVFQEIDGILFENIAAAIAKNAKLNTFSTTYHFEDDNSAGKWLGDFITLLLENKKTEVLNNFSYPILPNQNGDFRTKESLSSGKGTDEILKTVCSELGYDFRENLVDDTMPVTFTNEKVTDENIAEKIIALIGNLMTDMENDEKVRAAFLRLFNWFTTNPTTAEDLFGELYRNRHRLCPAEDILSSVKKAADYDQIMKEFDISNTNELRERLQQTDTDKSVPELTPVTKEILLSLGVKNYEEFKIALKDKNLSELFGHESVPSHEYFLFVESMINRTIQRIQKYLEELGYDFCEAEKTATTVFSGVIKENRTIDIVCRPSDNGEVIFYFGAEKQTLQNEGSELWVENGSTDPLQLSLGKILTDNDINKIKVK